jgi:hypothetical protein
MVSGGWETTVRRYRQLRALSLAELTLLLRCMVLLPWTQLKLASSGYQATLKGCSKLHGKPIRDLDLARRIARIVDVAARRGPFPAKCLCRSLVLLRLLSANGVRGEVKLGARKQGDDFGAHAWVCVDGVVVNDSRDVTLHYAPFPDTPAGTK